MGVFILALGTVFSQLFKMPVDEYLPFLATGYLLWFFISTLLTEAPNLFVENAAYLQDLKINLLVLLMRVVARNVIIFFHNIVIIIVLYFYFELWPGWAAIAALPGFLLVVANLTVVSLTLGILGARYRDIAPIIQNLVQVLFFISPITWLPKLVGGNSPILYANPIAHLLELVRSPLLGSLPPALSWEVAGGLLVVNLVIALALYVSKSRRVVFWV